jgi:hypothetical protein
MNISGAKMSARFATRFHDGGSTCGRPRPDRPVPFLLFDGAFPGSSTSTSRPSSST